MAGNGDDARPAGALEIRYGYVDDGAAKRGTAAVALGRTVEGSIVVAAPFVQERHSGRRMPVNV